MRRISRAGYRSNSHKTHPCDPTHVRARRQVPRARQGQGPAYLAACAAARSPMPFGDGPEATRLAVEHLGYVQIDTINVIERCHHHILYARIPGYRRTHLHQAQSVDKTVFEYWTHALSYVPTRDIRFFLGAMRSDQHAERSWFATVTNEDLRKVLTLIRKGRPAHHSRHRRRRAGGEEPRLGEPQALEARAAGCLLQGRGDRQPARRHAQDLRADGSPLRLGRAARGPHPSARSWTTCSTGRCARRGSSASIPSAISTPGASRPCGG